MKKICFIWLLTILSVTVFSCNRTNNNQSKKNNDKIVGTWNMDVTHIVKYVNGKKVKDKNETFDSGEYSKITFKSNQTYVATSFTNGHKVTENGTYSLKDGKLTTKPSSSIPKSGTFPSLPSMNYKIDGDKMVLSIKGDKTINGQQEKFNMNVELQKEG